MKIIKKILFLIIACALGVAYSYGTWPDEIYDTSVSTSVYDNIGQIKQGDVVEQEFLCPQNGLYGLNLKLSDLGQECKGTYHWSLQKVSDGKEVTDGKILVEKLDNESTYNLRFDSIENSKNIEYKLIITGDNVKSENGISVMATPGTSEKSDIRFNEEDTGQIAVIDLQMKYFSMETFVVFIGLALYLAFFTLFLLRIFK